MVKNTFSACLFDFCVGRINLATFGAVLTSHCSGHSGCSIPLPSTIPSSLSAAWSSLLAVELFKLTVKFSRSSVTEILLLLYFHTLCTLIGVWQSLIPSPPPGEPARLWTSPPAALTSLLIYIWKNGRSNNSRNKRNGMREKAKERTGTSRNGYIPPLLLPTSPESASPSHSIELFIWAGTSQLQWPPGSPSPLCRILQWNTAQRSARGCIRPISIPLPSSPHSKVWFTGFPTTYRGRIDVPVSGPPSCHRRRTSIMCGPLGAQNVFGRHHWVHARSVICRTW